MGSEVDLMRLYPKPKNRMTERPQITDRDREISRRFDFDYFDGDRQYGYGGFTYHPRFWTDTVDLFTAHYGLSNESAILDVGCGKGFMLKDFRIRLPQATLAGIDISEYAIENADPDIAAFVNVGDASDLPFADAAFDLVVSINTIHNLDRPGCLSALSEIQRVSRGQAFVVVDGWHNSEEKSLLENWVLTAKTMLSQAEWVGLMSEAGYSGDYSLWNPLS